MQDSKFMKLERLIDEYECAIFDPLFDPKKTEQLCTEVEAEADRTGYNGHVRLMALHTMHEHAAEIHERSRS
jgi:hypothetical protein